MKVTGDIRRCMSTGICEAICPEVFQVGPQGVEVLVEGPLPDELQERAIEAVANCPTEAIKATDD